MACTTCSSSSPVVSYTSSGCGSALGTSVSCVMPRRVSTPSVTPVSFTWIPSMIQAGSGKAVIANGEDFNVLDCAYDGPVVFDASTGKIYVGTTSASTVVADNFSYESSTLYGKMVYALDPGCREIGANPDRNFALITPPESNTGILFGHQHTCSSSTALAEEITPVEIVPGVMPDTFPDDVKLLAYRIVPAVDSCTPQTVQYYAHNGVPVVEDEFLDELVLTNDDLTDTTSETFGFALWDKINGKWELKRLTKAAFLDMIDTSSTVSTFTHIRPRPAMYYRSLTGTTAFTTANINYDLTSAPSYDAKYSSALISIDLAAYTGTRSFDIYVEVDGEEFARVRVGLANGTDSVSSQIIVPIPASKQINIQALEYTHAVGTYGPTIVSLKLDAFVL